MLYVTTSNQLCTHKRCATRAASPSSQYCSTLNPSLKVGITTTGHRCPAVFIASLDYYHYKYNSDQFYNLSCVSVYPLGYRSPPIVRGCIRHRPIWLRPQCSQKNFQKSTLKSRILLHFCKLKWSHFQCRQGTIGTITIILLVICTDKW